jgi:hypothetical protein
MENSVLVSIDDYRNGSFIVFVVFVIPTMKLVHIPQSMLTTQ